jgi:hypothetical protein
MVTFNDPEVSRAVKLYEARKKLIHGLHFLLVTPDDSGIICAEYGLKSENRSN